MIVADTDVLIDFLGGHDPAAARVALELERGDLRTTAVTRFELLSGARSPKQRTNIVALLGAIGTLPLDAAAADRAAEVRRSLDEKGIGIGMGDSLIAGIVLVAGGVLLTRNRDHFKRVEGLHLGRLGSVAEDQFFVYGIVRLLLARQGEVSIGEGVSVVGDAEEGG